jgi:hypothetical protein
MLEAGIQSGTEPWEERRLTSILAEFLDLREISVSTVDRAAFPMRLLHFRRTFVEKLFTIHDKMERRVLQDGLELGSFARHYYDLYHLLQTPEVQALLSSEEYAVITADYQRLTRMYFPSQVLPRAMCLRDSVALFPDNKVAAALGRSYDDQCRRLCYGEFPRFTDILSAFEEWRKHLIGIEDLDTV